MRSNHLFVSFGVALCLLQSTAWAGNSGALQQKFGPGQINWTEQYIEATGNGIPKSTGNPAQEKLLAQRAATADAYRQLAEVINGVQVTAETTVRNFVVESDVVRTRVQAVLKGATPVGQPNVTSDGVTQVTVRMPLYGQLARAIELDSVVRSQMHSLSPLQPIRIASSDLSELPFLLARCQRFEPVENTENTETEASSETLEEPSAEVAGEVTEEPAIEPEFTESEASAESDKASEVPPEPTAEPNLQAESPDKRFTGLIIDARGMGLNPSMSPMVHSDSRQVYVGKFPLDIDRVIAEGIILYYDSLDIALDSKRVGSHPLIVRPIGTDKHQVDFVLHAQDAEQIQKFDQRDHFLQELQVVAVLD